jgi:DNA-binding LacI/PurR family transcriptional regulator
MSKHVTMKQVAQHANVSYQTVSRVINNSPDVAQETRERVLDAIRQLNYHPSLAARVLSKKHSSIIGVVIPHDTDFLVSDPHLLKVIAGINRTVAMHDNSMLLSTPRSKDNSISAYTRLLKERIVDGIIVDGGMGESFLKLLVDKGYPVVITGYNSLGIPSVHPDDEGGAYMLTQHLLALGHTSIGVIRGPDYTATLARWQGLQRALSDSGIDSKSFLYTTGDFTTPSGYQGAKYLMAQDDPPTAIFAFNDRMAIGAIYYLREHGYEIPGKISVVGFDDIVNVSNIEDPDSFLTTVRIFSADIGQRGAELLFDLIEGHTPDSTEIIIPTQLIVRRSTALAEGVRTQRMFA